MRIKLGEWVVPVEPACPVRFLNFDDSILNRLHSTFGTAGTTMTYLSTHKKFDEDGLLATDLNCVSGSFLTHMPRSSLGKTRPGLCWQCRRGVFSHQRTTIHPVADSFTSHSQGRGTQQEGVLQITRLTCYVLDDACSRRD